MKAVVDSLVQELLMRLEIEAKRLIEEKLDEVVDKALNDLKEKIKGNVDDVIIDALRVTVKAELKKFALELAEKISKA